MAAISSSLSSTVPLASPSNSYEQPKIVTLIDHFAPDTVLATSLVPTSEVYRRFEVLSKWISHEGIENIKKLEVPSVLTEAEAAKQAARKEKLFNTLLTIGERLESTVSLTSPKSVKVKKNFDFIHTKDGRFFIKQDTLLGIGKVKHVYEGLDLKNLKTVAWGSITNEQEEVKGKEKEAETNIDDAEREMRMLATIHINLEPDFRLNIVSSYEAAIKIKGANDNDELILVQEKLEKGESLVGSKSSLMLSKVQFLKGIANGLRGIHLYNIVHMDIRPANFLFAVSEDKSLVGKLADFGGALDLENDEEESDKKKREEPRVRTLTDAYAAPGLNIGDIPKDSDDCYSMGVSIFEFISGRKGAVQDFKDRMFKNLRDTEVQAEIDREIRLINLSNEEYLNEKSRIETLILEERAKPRTTTEKLRKLDDQLEMMTYYQSLNSKDKAVATEMITLCKSLILRERRHRMSAEILWKKLGEIESRHFPKEVTVQPPTS